MQFDVINLLELNEIYKGVRMYIKFSTAICKGKDAKTVSEEAVKIAKNKLGNIPINLSIVYCSSDYDYKTVVETIRVLTDNAPLIGASTAGEFNEEKSMNGSIALGFLSSDEIKFHTALIRNLKNDPEESIRKIISNIPDGFMDCSYLTAIMLFDGLTGLGEEIAILTSYIFEQIHNKKVKLIGGLAGDDMKFKETFVFSDDNVDSNAMSICLLSSNIPLFTSVKHGHKPLSKLLTVTKAKGNTVFEIDGKPAWKIWWEEISEAFNKRNMHFKNIDDSTQKTLLLGNYELGLYSNEEKEYKIRFPQAVNDDDSISFACGIAEGSVFRIMDGSSKENQINVAREVVEIAKLEAEKEGITEFSGLLVFECGVRLKLLGKDFYKSVENYKKSLPDVPVLGFETYGEIRMEPGKFSGFHNTTSVILLLPKITNTDK